MEGEKFIIGEAERHLQASAGKNMYRVIDAVREMPTFEGPVLPRYVSAMEGTRYPASAEDMHIRRDGWEGSYNGTIARAAQAVLEAGQTREA